jgi:hypothetical protein
LLQTRRRLIDPLSEAGEFSAIDVAENQYGLAVTGCYKLKDNGLLLRTDSRVKNSTPDNLISQLCYQADDKSFFLYRLL